MWLLKKNLEMIKKLKVSFKENTFERDTQTWKVEFNLGMHSAMLCLNFPPCDWGGHTLVIKEIAGFSQPANCILNK